MITFTKPDKNMDILRPFFSRYGGVFNDLTLGARFMWGDEFDIKCAIVGDTLILRETYGGSTTFYYPMGKDVNGAISAVEEYCAKTGTDIIFRCLTEKQAQELSERYAGAKINYLRDWSDYIYPAEQFKTYAGKKLSGQRNHVNRFKKLYPDYKVSFITETDVPRIKDFLKEYEKENDLGGLAKDEEARVYGLLDNMENLGQFGILITVGGEIVSFSVGETVGDMLFVHIEKGLKEYGGVYPTTAQEFAKAFAAGGVKFINREEDCGDLGLRVSKTQYHPSEIKPKYYITASSAFSLITPPVKIETARLEITDIFEDDKDVYAALYRDDKVNEFYGYDYHTDLGDNTPDGDYFFNFMQTLKSKREEYSLAVRLSGKMIGEIVFYNFGYFREAEIGFRFFREYQGKGYAFESVKAAIEYAFQAGFRKIKSRHFKENARSEKLILKLGFAFTEESKTHKFYELKK